MARTPGFKIAKTTNDMLAETRKPKVQPETGWWRVGEDEEQEIPFGVGWGNAATASMDLAPLRYYLADDGEVRIHGHITGGDIGSIIFTLPHEARPEFAETFICPLDDGVGHATIRIHVNGDVELVNIV